MSSQRVASRFTRICVLVKSLIIPISLLNAFPADALSPAVTDTRSVGMGNTSSVSAVSSSAMFYNPGLLGDLEFFDIQIGGRYSFGRAYNDYAADDYYDARYHPVLTLTQVSLALPIQPEDFYKIVPALGYHLHLDGTRYAILDWVHDMGEIHVTDTLVGGFSTITAAVAFMFDDKYSLGLVYSFGGLQRIRGKYVETIVYDSLNADTSAGYYERWCFVSQSGFSSEGSFFQIGVFAEPISQIAVSASVRTPLNWGWRRGADTLSASLTTWDRSHGWRTAGASLIILYDDSTAYKIPAILTFGVRSKLLPFLTLAGEFETRPYSNLQIGGDYMTIENGCALRVGAEFTTPVLFRAGFYAEAIPQADSGYYTPKYLKAITLGVGIPVASFLEINGGFEYAFWGKKFSQEGDLYREKLFRFGTSVRLILPGLKEGF